MAERMNDRAAEAAKKGQEATKEVGTPVDEVDITITSPEGNETQATIKV